MCMYIYGILFSTDMGTNFARQGVAISYGDDVGSRIATDGNPRSCTITYYHFYNDFHWWRVYFKKVILVREVRIINAFKPIVGKYSVHGLFCSQ